MVYVLGHSEHFVHSFVTPTKMTTETGPKEGSVPVRLSHRRCFRSDIETPKVFPRWAAGSILMKTSEEALMPTAQELLPDPNKPLRDHSDLQLLAMALFGEARGEPPQTREGIGHAIINRALHPSWWGRDLAEVILKPWQFSSFNGPEVIPGIRPNQID